MTSTTQSCLPSFGEQMRLLAEYYSTETNPVSAAEMQQVWRTLDENEQQYYRDWALVLYGLEQKKTA